ncbi:MAG: polyprenyl synthetase family protein [Veillonella sp.]|nr:polyprenyl synthetase family protein [Veillonella sp.]
MDIKVYLNSHKDQVETWLEGLLVSPNTEYSRLYEAMNYSLLLGGKRIRPSLTMAVLEAFGLATEPYKEILCAMECIHTYSLIHDDLPAMDNDDFRRGKPTNHKAYGEGMAILAGDGLLTAAFQLAASCQGARPDQLIAIIRVLATCAGPEGMVGGQAFDLMSEGQHIPLEELKVLHRGKTGALFLASVEIALILADAEPKVYQDFMVYADRLGLLFQITDDILDITGTVEELGKTPGSDLRQDKSTYVSLLGLEGAKEEAARVADKAKASIAGHTANTEALEALVDYLMTRTH